MRKGLSGHLRIAAIPTAMPMLSELTTPFHEKHADVRFTLMSASSNEVLRLIENLEADAGITYPTMIPSAGSRPSRSTGKATASSPRSTPRSATAPA